ncbi:hypothetical protein [Sphingomonas bacterium]|uniref:hypothetical protein n=1 Tax=Sphingomonas bacterium TaxID=1895847 RepID=UPI00157536C2|nr:hypothetical protein [Sphingomonas bacterium]
MTDTLAPTDTLTAKLTAIVERAPDCIRQELASKDPAARSRAEEVLAAIIANALREPDQP